MKPQLPRPSDLHHQNVCHIQQSLNVITSTSVSLRLHHTLSLSIFAHSPAHSALRTEEVHHVDARCDRCDRAGLRATEKKREKKRERENESWKNSHLSLSLSLSLSPHTHTHIHTHTHSFTHTHTHTRKLFVYHYYVHLRRLPAQF